ncbi:hypothetical protein [Shewanella halifaxensis]|uniref:hypothetical protein n=1 Tax=Shewanella halifaxensis TaxID=271098 RepID=UPI000D594400|nr:hypothetical protein [Shewanella halifaxensis]
MSTAVRSLATNLNAANEQLDSCQNVAETAISAMRQMLGKNSAASRFDKLNPQQRAMILFAARLKPSEYINKPLLSLSLSDRDAVRQAIISLTDLAKTFGCVSLSRDQFLSQPKPRVVKSIGVKREAIGEEDELSREIQDINALAAELALEVEQQNRC